MESTQITTNHDTPPRINVTGSVLAGAAVGAGLLAAVGAGAGYVSGLESMSPFIGGLSIETGAMGGAAVGAAMGGLNGLANAKRLERERDVLPPKARNESFADREIKRRAIAQARAAYNAEQGSAGPALA